MRVIAGKFRGRPLRTPRGASTRPTADRVREALFSMLAERVVGAHIVDLYAGSGALGIEALSRGAADAVFVESARPALAAIRANLTELQLTEQSHVLAMPVERARAVLRSHTPFDIVFCDPPWSDVASAARLMSGLASEIMSSNAVLVFEHRRPDTPELTGPGTLALRDRRIWGDTAISLFEQPAERP